jgi:hypothetical protein
VNRTIFTAAIITFIAIVSLSVTAIAGPVPDTGQTQSYTDTFGEDSDYTCNPHSYTDLGNGIVRDNVTGLEWQQATAPGTYTWQQAIDYCNNLILGGYTDWRLPTIKELSTLVDSSIPYPGPSINTSYFPDTVAYDYWSSTTDAYYTYYAWLANFVSGLVSYSSKPGDGYVRAVRGGQSGSLGNLVINSDGTVTDTNTGLMWQQATAPGTYNWEQALTYCESLSLGGHSDWRLPNRNELQSIVDYSRHSPAIDTTFFPNTASSRYWSSTTGPYDTGYAWNVGFLNGFGGGGDKDSYGSVRAVRGGQCESPTVINLASFNAAPKSGKVILGWVTESEIDNAGFNIFRAEAEDGDYTKINASFLSAKGFSTQGASYEFTDTNVQNRKTYWYKLEDINLNGTSTMHEPVSATPRLIYGLSK